MLNLTPQNLTAFDIPLEPMQKILYSDVIRDVCHDLGKEYLLCVAVIFLGSILYDNTTHILPFIRANKRITDFLEFIVGVAVWISTALIYLQTRNKILLLIIAVGVIIIALDLIKGIQKRYKKIGNLRN